MNLMTILVLVGLDAVGKCSCYEGGEANWKSGSDERMVAMVLS